MRARKRRALAVMISAMLLTTGAVYNAPIRYNTLVAEADTNNSEAKKNAQGYPRLDTLKEDPNAPEPKKITSVGVTYIEGVLIANKTYDLPSSYDPGDLEETTQAQLNKMFDAAAKDGYTLTVVSGYRSYDLQNTIYTNYCDEQGQEKADTFSARPGYSEHQTGLSADINNASDAFKDTPEAKWLAKNCYKYGFIIRYPDGKQSITGYKYEPWHVRYVGGAKAKAIYESGVCLEEYLGITSEYGADKVIPDQQANLSGGNPNKNNTTIGKTDDDWVDSWVNHKDDWRYGLDKNTNGKVQVEFKPGMGDGRYTITLAKGTYYWYHQTSTICDCDYCGTWSTANWGQGDFESEGGKNYHKLGKDGDAIYSSAMIISNLTNKDVTPTDWLRKLGCESKNGGKLFITNNTAFENKTELKIAEATKKMKEEYNLETKELSKDKLEDDLKEILDKDGLVWYQYKCDNTDDTSGWWPSKTTDSHFIVIYAYDDNGFYILDESLKKYDNMNQAVAFNDLKKCAGDKIIGVWNPNPPKVWVEGNGGSYTATGEWYSDAKNIGKYKNTVEVGSLGGQKFYLYDGLPWAYETGTYVFDTSAALTGLYDYVKKVSGQDAVSIFGYDSAEKVLDTKRRMHNEATYPISASSKGFKEVNGCVYKVVDNVACIAAALPPAVIDSNYCKNFGNFKEGVENYWLKSATAQVDYGYGTRKFAFVLKEFSTGKIFYLPVLNADAKAHTFPGGLCQTNRTLAAPGYGDNSGAITLDSSGAPSSIKDLYIATWLSDFGTTFSGSWSQLGELMNSSNGGFTGWDYVHNVGECIRVPTEVANTVVDSGDYQIIGVVAWPN